MRYMLAATAGALLLAACVTHAPVGQEWVGKPLRVDTAAGDVATVLLRSDGTTTLTSLKGEQAQGTWRLQGDRLCVAYPETLFLENECVINPGPLKRGIKTPLRNAEGHIGWITLM